MIRVFSSILACDEDLRCQRKHLISYSSATRLCTLKASNLLPSSPRLVRVIKHPVIFYKYDQPLGMPLSFDERHSRRQTKLVEDRNDKLAYCNTPLTTREDKDSVFCLTPIHEGVCRKTTKILRGQPWTALPSALHVMQFVPFAQAQSLKQAILDQASGTSNGLNASAAQRDAISKAVNGLVALNPTNDLTTSELATGEQH